MRHFSWLDSIRNFGTRSTRHRETVSRRWQMPIAHGSEVLESRTVPTVANPFQPAVVPEALAYESTNSGSFTASSQTRDYTVTLDAGQTLSVKLSTTDAALRGRVSVLGPTGIRIGNIVEATAGGQTVLRQSVAAVDAGTYTVRVQNAAGLGTFQLQMLLNARWEAEASGAATNETRETAEPMSTGRLILAPGVDEMAVRGEIVAGQTDFYAVTLREGTYVSIAAHAAGNAPLRLELQDSSGALVTFGNSDGPSAYIRDFAVPTAGTYYLRVTGNTNASYGVVVSRNAQLGLEQGDNQHLGEKGVVLGRTGSEMDGYVFNVTQPTTLSITTRTPFDGVNDPVNNADPNVSLFYLDGLTPDVPVATDDNSSPFARNAMLSSTIGATGLGRYRVKVGSPIEGGYLLRVGSSVEGAITSKESGFRSIGVATRVAGNSSGSIVSANLSNSFDVAFNEAVDLTSVTPGDLTIGGVSATQVTPINENFLHFDFGPIAVSGNRVDAVIEVGAIRSISGHAFEPMDRSLELDHGPPHVIATSIAENESVTLGERKLDITFDEPLNATASRFLVDAQLRNITTNEVITISSGENNGSLQDGQFLSFTQAGLRFSLTVEGDYEFRLLSNNVGYTDRLGNHLDGDGDGIPSDFVRHFHVSGLPLNPFQPTILPAAEVFESTNSGSFTTAAQTKDYKVNLDAGQTMSLMFSTSDSALRAGLQVLGPNGQSLVNAIDATTGGQTLRLQAVPVIDAGTYTIRVRNNAGLGQFQLGVLLNARWEIEGAAVATNDSRATAEQINTGRVTLVPGVDQMAVRGALGANQSDFYAVTLRADMFVSFAADGAAADVHLELQAPDGTLLALGQSGHGADSLIRDFAVPTAGTYFVRVSSDTATSYGVVVTRNATLGLDQGDNQDLGSRGNVLGRIDTERGSESYLLEVTQPTTLTIATRTPFDGVNEPTNDADPNIALFYLDGLNPTLTVASDDNSSPFARNATLNYVVDASHLGTYRVTVNSPTTGNYLLRANSSVVGALQTTLPIFAATSPDLGPTVVVSDLSAVPTTVRLDFNEPLNFASVSASDLTVNGIAATNVTRIDEDSLVFNLGTTISRAGSFAVNLSAGAIQSVSGRAIADWTSQVIVDLNPPHVASMSVGDSGVPLGSKHIQITFDEPVSRPASLASAIAIANATTGQVATLSNVSYTGDDRITSVSFDAALSGEGAYQLHLFSNNDSFRDVAGRLLDGDLNHVGSDDYLSSFSYEDPQSPLSPFSSNAPQGSLVWSTIMPSNFNRVGDVDTATTDLDAGQTVQLSLSVFDASTRGRVELIGPDGTVLAQAESPAAGRPAITAIVATPTAGQYRIRTTSLAGIGSYSVDVSLNALREAELVTNVANNDVATAQNIDLSSVLLSGHADRLAVRGGVEASDNDTFAFTMTAGQTATLVASSDVRDAVSLELLAADGQVLSVSRSMGPNISIENFVAPAGGTFLARVRGTSHSAYTLVVTRDAAFDVGRLTSGAVADPVDIGRTGIVLGHTSVSSGTGASGASSNTGNNRLNDSTGLLWDLNSNGTVSDGTSDAYDGGMQLSVNGLSFPNSAIRWEENGRELILGPVNMGSLQVTRKIYVPSNAGFARFLDLVTNPGPTAVTANVGIFTNLGSDGSEPFRATSSGDNVLSTADDWVVTDDSTGAFGDPAVGHAISGPGAARPTSASYNPGAINYGYSLPIGPGETRGVLHFGVQSFNSGVATNMAASLAALQGESLTGLSDSDLAAITNFRVNVGDSYLLNVTQPTTLTISTATPGDGVNAPTNNANPNISLFFLNGTTPRTAVASDDNSSPDGRNAALAYAVDAAHLGTYRIYLGSTTDGAYTLRVASSVEGAVQSSLPTFAVTTTDLNPAVTVAAMPASIRVDFNEPVNFGSVSASDLTVAGVAASGVTLVDADTLQFTIGNTTSAEGRHDIVLDVGAIQSLSGRSLGRFTTQVSVDRTAPRVATTSVAENAIIPLGTRTFSIAFDEPVARPIGGLASAQLLNVTTNQPVTLSNLVYVGADRITGISFDATLATEAEYRLTLFSRSDTFVDSVGNRLDGDGDGTPNDFVRRFFADDVDGPLPAFNSQSPAGSLVRSTSLIRTFTGPGDVDSFSVDLNAGQTVQVCLTGTTASTRGRVELIGPDGITVLAQAESGASGQAALTPIAATATAGRYRIRAVGLEGSGEYRLSVLLNAVQEAESLSGPSNDDLATAQDIGASRVTLSDSADRLAVRGRANASSVDLYSFSLTAGQPVMLVADGAVRDSLAIELLAADGQVLITGQQLGLSNVIENFRPATSGTYFVRVRGIVETDYTLVATRNASFAIASPSRGLQDLGETGIVVGAFSSNSINPILVSPGVFEFEVTRPTSLTLVTTTPSDGAGPSTNPLDPIVDLYYLEGASPNTLIATNDNGASDGRNVRLNQTIDSTSLGTYRAVIRRANVTQAGDYTLQLRDALAGAVQSNRDPAVTPPVASTPNILDLNAGASDGVADQFVIQMGPTGLQASVNGVAVPVPVGTLGVRVIGSSDNDTLSLQFADGYQDLPAGIAFAGGSQILADTLQLSGSIRGYLLHRVVADQRGVVSVGSMLIRYRGLESVDDQALVSAREFQFAANFNDVISLRDQGVVSDQFIQIVSNRGLGIRFPTSGDVTIATGLGNDIVTIEAIHEARPTNVVIRGGDGNDIINTTQSLWAMTLLGEAGDDSLTGANGDTTSGSGAADSIDGGIGNDLILGLAGNDVLFGGTGDDTVRGGAGNDSIQGGAGDDLITGGAGDDSIDGGDGDDRLAGFAGRDLINGNAGRDFLAGGDDNDSLMGGSGPDSLVGGLGADLVNGQGGTNAAAGGDGTGRNSGDEMSGLTDVFDELRRFLILPDWARIDAGANGD